MGQFCCKENADSDECQSLHLVGGKVQLITTLDCWKEKLSEAEGSDNIIVVNFSAPWCAPCRDMAPTFRDLADKYSSFMFVVVDVDEMAELSASWDVKATPTFYFLRDGSTVDKLVGANKIELQKKLAALAKATMTPPS